MRRLACALALAVLASAHAVPSAAYLHRRAGMGIVRAVPLAALRTTTKARTLELSGTIIGTCGAGDTATLILKGADDDEQGIEAKTPPDWLTPSSTPVRLLVRAERGADGRVTVTLIDAAPEMDVLPAEEAYWRALAAKRHAAEAKAPRSLASRGANVARGPIYGAIGRPARAKRTILPLWRVAPVYAAFIRGRNPRLSPDKAMGIANDLIRFCNGYGIDARLVVAILIVESGFDPNAVSHSGAVGLGQLMPETARWMGIRDSYDTTQNLFAMVKLLHTHSLQFGRSADDPVVLAAYNAGEGAVRRHGGVPPYRETQAYVRRVTAIFHQLCRA